MAFEIIQTICILLFAVVCHEYAHGWVAYKCGDPTAKLLGRLTLNPLKHIDPVGMIAVPLLLRLLHFKFVIGWAKPVPVNFSLLRNPKRDMIWVALAGPITNFVLAFLLSRILFIFHTGFVAQTLSLAVILNLIIGTFNLIPIPPLDGSKILLGLLPQAWGRQFVRFEPAGFVILLVLMNLGLLNFVWFFALFLTIIFGVDPSLL